MIIFRGLERWPVQQAAAQFTAIHKRRLVAYVIVHVRQLAIRSATFAALRCLALWATSYHR